MNDSNRRANGRLAVAMIVADPADLSAFLVAEHVARRSPDHTPIVIAPHDLSVCGWTHHIDPTGRTTTTLALRGRPVLDDHHLASVWFRSASVPATRFDSSSPADRDYAHAELAALVVSWLRGLDRVVVNRVDGSSLSGPSWSPLRWRHEAAAVGLPVMASTVASSARVQPAWQGSSYEARLPSKSDLPIATDELVVVGDRVFGPLAAEHGAAAVALAARAGCRVLHVRLAPTAEGPRVVDVQTVGTIDRDDVAAAVADLLTTTDASWAA